IAFKFRYIKYKLKKLSLKGTDYKVLTSLFKDIVKYLFPFLYSFVVKVYSTKLFSFFSQYRVTRKELSSAKSISHIFFFPYYHIGGAEKVHAAILETVAQKKPLVIITSRSDNSALLPEFKKSAAVINVSELLIWPFSRAW